MSPTELHDKMLLARRFSTASMRFVFT